MRLGSSELQRLRQLHKRRKANRKAREEACDAAAKQLLALFQRAASCLLFEACDGCTFKAKAAAAAIAQPLSPALAPSAAQADDGDGGDDYGDGDDESGAVVAGSGPACRWSPVDYGGTVARDLHAHVAALAVLRHQARSVTPCSIGCPCIR